VPVIASDAGHFRTFLGDGAAGIIADTPGEAADAMVAIMGDTARFAAMAAAARARCEGQFGIAREAQAIAAVYDALWKEGTGQQK
ncbi:MAG: glycosyltransferase family 1 protein, partial [Notoacmeibacter sp.]|nr:glycosyltransferase family 1 protein [Notoacmeibacter sp.]